MADRKHRGHWCPRRPKIDGDPDTAAPLACNTGERSGVQNAPFYAENVNEMGGNNDLDTGDGV